MKFVIIQHIIDKIASLIIPDYDTASRIIIHMYPCVGSNDLRFLLLLSNPTPASSLHVYTKDWVILGLDVETYCIIFFHHGTCVLNINEHHLFHVQQMLYCYIQYTNISSNIFYHSSPIFHEQRCDVIPQNSPDISTGKADVDHPRMTFIAGFS